MERLKDIASEAETVLIVGHLRPDGDCVGACMAVYRYLHKQNPEQKISVYLEAVPEAYNILEIGENVISAELPKEPVDLLIALDSSSRDRLGIADTLFDSAAKTLCVDHHISNTGYAALNVVRPEASSTCEVLYDMMDEDEVDKEIAAALYLGIIFDTGVFRYSNTTRHTMEVAGRLMETGIPFWQYIDECFCREPTYRRSCSEERCLPVCG